MIELKNTEEMAESLASVLSHLVTKCENIVPRAGIEHIGSSSIPGALSKGDIDILVLVELEYFQEAKAALDSEFSPNPGMPAEDDFVSYSGSHLGTDFGIQLAAGSDDKFQFLALKEKLLTSPDLLEKYNRLKIDHSGDSMDKYRKAKSKFIHAIVGE